MKKTLLLATLGVALTGTASAYAEEINVYSYRQPELLKPLTDAFEAETGIKTNVLFAKQGLVDRVVSEGENSPADVLLTVDIGRLDAAKQAGVWQPIPQEITADIPQQYVDPDGAWAALSLRARVFYVSKDRVEEENLSYADLADPKWKGRVCTRSGQHVYSIGLIASQIANNGEEATKEWLEDVRDNLARKPTGNDRAQVKAIYSGECDIAIGNTYYMGKMLTNETEPEQKDWAASVRLVYPDAEQSKTHVNISGVVLAKHAPNAEAGQKFIDFLLSEEAQSIYAESNFEFPVLPGVEASDLVASWGELKADDLALSEIADKRDEASKLVDEVKFDEGPQN
ncbi:extracellular solute-binding protein [Maritalea mediterranea]|uniref:Extracellular solute-binding protein n=1 Tax=Maritalea mediterranea TaxID=2909667 RepID=A0ABS9E6A5_9HYPH|nr:extracellular solute-binding protein [Maritalea mediterranea]MCF4097747.1 extracellular solute-binding protein [Maritalea mediterranea]